MQLAMVGLGRMGANMVKRLAKNGHECVVFDRSAETVADLAKERRRHRCLVHGGPDRQAFQATRYLADDSRRRRRADRRRSRQTPRTRRHPHRWRQLLLHRRHRAREDARLEGHRVCRRWHQRRCLGPRARLLHDDWRQQSDRRAPRPHLQDHRPRTRHHRPYSRVAQPDVGTAEDGYLYCGPNGAGHFTKMVHNGIEYGMMAAYAEGLRRAEGREHRKDTSTRSMPRRRHFAILSTTSTSLTSPRSPKSGVAAASSLRGCSTSPPLLLLTTQQMSKFGGRVSDSGEGRWTIKAGIDEGVPTPVLTASLYERFSSRGNSLFSDKLLSAMRFQFGGHHEKPAEQVALSNHFVPWALNDECQTQGTTSLLLATCEGEDFSWSPEASRQSVEVGAKSRRF